MTLPSNHGADKVEAIVSSNVSHIKTPTNQLLSVPREIRDDIFTYLVRARDLAILRTSKQFHHEARERLHRDGVFRVNIGSFDPFRVSDFPDEWEKFQHFHIRIYYTGEYSLPSSESFWQLDRIANLDEAHLKRECLVTVDWDGILPWHFYPHLPNTEILPRKMASLTAFTTVVVVLAADQYTMLEREEVCENFWERYKRAFEKTMAHNWSRLQEILEPALGPGKLVGGTNGEERRLICHPREFRSSLARKQQVSDEYSPLRELNTEGWDTAWSEGIAPR